MQVQLTPSIMAVLPQWVARQRWYAGKGRVPVLRRIGGLRLEDPAGKVEISIHLLLDESGRTPTTYQVPLTCRTSPLADGDQALVATMELGGDGPQRTLYYYDAPHDPAFATALLALMLDERTAPFDGKKGDGKKGDEKKGDEKKGDGRRATRNRDPTASRASAAPGAIGSPRPTRVRC